MADQKKRAEEVMAKAMLAAGKDAAKQAALDMLGSDEERAVTEADEADKTTATKTRRTKWIILAVLSAFVLIGVLGLVVSYWYYFLAVGLLGLALFYARWRWRRRRAAKEQGEEKPDQKIEVDERREQERPLRIDEEAGAVPSSSGPEAQACDPRAEARARAEAAAIEAAEIEDELSSLKARLKQ